MNPILKTFLLQELAAGGYAVLESEEFEPPNDTGAEPIPMEEKLLRFLRGNRE